VNDETLMKEYDDYKAGKLNPKEIEELREKLEVRMLEQKEVEAKISAELKHNEAATYSRHLAPRRKKKGKKYRNPFGKNFFKK